MQDLAVTPGRAGGNVERRPKRLQLLTLLPVNQQVKLALTLTSHHLLGFLGSTPGLLHMHLSLCAP